jgi:hypothetical protein
MYTIAVLTHMDNISYFNATIQLFMANTLIFYFLTALKNPGIFSSTDPNARDSKIYCIPCKVKRQDDIVHWYKITLY